MLESILYFLGSFLFVQCQYNFNIHFQSHFPQISWWKCPKYHVYVMGLDPHSCVSYHKDCLGVTQVEAKSVKGLQILCHPNYQVNLTSKARLHKNFYVDPTKSITISLVGKTSLNYTTDVQIPNCFIVYAWLSFNGTKSSMCWFYSGNNVFGNQLLQKQLDNGTIQYYSQLDEFTIILCPNSNCSDCIFSQNQKSYNCTSCIGDNYITETSKDCSLVCPITGGLCDDQHPQPKECRAGFLKIQQDDGTFICKQCPDDCLYCFLPAGKQCKKCIQGKVQESSFYTMHYEFDQCQKLQDCLEYILMNSQFKLRCLRSPLGYQISGQPEIGCQKWTGFCFYCISTTCFICSDGYYLKQGECFNLIYCNYPCNTCIAGYPDQCTSCFYDAQLQGTNCVCPDSPEIYQIKGYCKKCNRGPCEICLDTFDQCLTCNSEIKFRFLLGNTCYCMDGYYEGEDEFYVCQQCHPTCLTCDGGEISNCLRCDQQQNRHFVKGQCICNQGFGEVDLNYSELVCQKCHQRCKTCIIANDPFSCTSCLSQQFRLLSTNQNCECLQSYGDNNGALDICYICHFSCESCIGDSQTDCVSCSDSSYRELINSSCVCKKGYFEDSTEQTICLNCHYSCINCLNNQESDQCTECADQRIPNGSGTTFNCVCQDSHYFDDYISQKCQPCHYSCLTCINFEQTDCSSCDLSIRKYQNQNCKCLVGTYDDGKSSCLTCHQTCLTCSGDSITDCLTCNYEGHNRYLKQRSCKCLQGYFEIDDQIMCQKCSYRCKECQLKKDQCLSCAVNSFRELGNDSNCLCPDGLFDLEGSSICQICHPKCLGCFGSDENQCTDCKPLANRYFSENKYLCKPHYYEEGVEQCSICSSYCFECDITYNNCTSCQRDRVLIGNNCQCATKIHGLLLSTYDIDKVECAKCHYSCLTCNGSTAKKCTSCYENEHRYLNGSQCQCISGYFDSGQLQCKICGYQCLTCISNENQCLSCKQNSLRSLNSQSRVCYCQNGYFDDGQNSICQKCDSSCFLCSIKSNRCLSCVMNSFRQFNEILFQCDCISGYYDNGEANCLPCHYSCQECSGFGNQQCKSCKISNPNTKRELLNQTCICQIGYYDDGYSFNCQPCDVSCDDCENQSYNCTACSTTRNYSNQACKCMSGYFDIGQKECKICDQNCLECKVSPKNCVACDSTKFKILNEQTKSCICKTNYLEINGVCEQCQSSCQTCQYTIDNCSSCESDRIMLNNQCLCQDGYFDYQGNCVNCHGSCLTCQNSETYCLTCSLLDQRTLTINHTCDCNEGYFDYSIMNTCEKCHYSCKTCMQNSQNCTSCDESLHLDFVQNQCLCKIGFYLDPITNICLKCHISCLSCVQYEKCTSCLVDSRDFDDYLEKCNCKEGYFEANQPNCQICDYQCFTCKNTKENCLSCHPLANRQLSGNMCNCKEGFYDEGIEVCMECGTRCKACVDKLINCILCYELEQQRVLSDSICQCKSGYFENGSDICEKCSTRCKTCVNSAEYCTSCDMDQKRLDHSIIHKCPCMKGFYDSEQQICEKCHIKCETCQNARENCLTCNSTQKSNRYLLSDQCNCKPGYYDEKQLECQKCSKRCKKCVESETNCLECSSNLRINSPICRCLDGYYEDKFQNCAKCSNQCQTCITEENNCLSCKIGRINKNCDCESGYFEAGEEQCMRCEFQCQECTQQQKCIKCKGNRIELPTCRCADGYYEDNINEDCQICDYRCLKCNLDGCYICDGNRILSSEKSCDPPENSISYDTTPWCSNCEVAVLIIRFSDDLNSIFVKFDFQLKQTQQVKQCNQILKNDTLSKLGIGYSCEIYQQDLQILQINLGQESSIVVGDQIQLIPGELQHLNCQQKLRTFIFDAVEAPLTILEPIIQFNVPINQISSCIENNIFQILLILMVKESLDEFIIFLNQNKFIDLYIPALTLPEDTGITFMIQVQNFLGSTSTTSFKINTQFDSQPAIELDLKSQYYVYQNIYIVFSIIVTDCHDFNQTQTPLFQINLIETNKSIETAASSKINFTKQSDETSYSILIPKYTLTAQTKYFFNLSVVDLNSQKTSSIKFSFEIIQAQLLCLFENAKYIQYYLQDLLIHFKCRDMNANLDWNEDEELSIEIKCIDLQTSEICLNQNNQKIYIKPNDYNQKVPKNSVKPYSVQSWIVVATKANLTKTFNQIIVFLEESFLPLTIQYDIAYNIRPINNYEPLNFTFDIPIQNKQNIVAMSVEIISDFVVLSLTQPKYYEFQMKFQEYIGQKKLIDSNYNIRFSVQYSTDITPSYFNLPVNLNLPPICSKVRQSQQNVNSLTQLEAIAICSKAFDSPFQYKFGYFLSEEDMQEFLTGNTGLLLGKIDYQMSPKFTSLVPNSFQNQSILYVVSVMDQGGSITNILGRTKIQNSFNCTIIINQNSTNGKPNFLLTQFIQTVGQDGQDCNKLQQSLLINLYSNINFKNQVESTLILQSLQISKKYSSSSKTQNSRILDESYFKSCYDLKKISFHLNQSFNNFSNQINKPLQQIDLEVNNFKTIVSLLTQQHDNLQIHLRNLNLEWDQKLQEQYDSNQVALLNLYLLPDNILISLSKFQTVSEQVYDNFMALLNLFSNISLAIQDTAKTNANPIKMVGKMISWKLVRESRENFKSQFGLNLTQEDQIIKFSQKEQIEVKLNPYIFSNWTTQNIQNEFKSSEIIIDNALFIQTQLKNFRQDGNQIVQTELEGKYTISMGEIPLCQNDQNSQDYDIICIQMQQEGNISQCSKKIVQQENKIIIDCQCQKFGQIFLIYNSLFENKDSTSEDFFINKDLSIQSFDFESPIFISFIAYVGLVGVISLYLIISQRNRQNAVVDIVKDQEQESNKQQLKCYPGNMMIVKENIKFLHQLTQFYYPSNSLIQKSYRFLDVNTQFSLILAIVHLKNFDLGKYQNSTEIFFMLISAIIYRIVSKILQGFARINSFLKNLIYVILLITLVISSLATSLKINTETSETNNRKLVNDLVGFIIYEVLIEPIIIISIIFTYRLTFKSISFKEFNRFYHLIYFFAYQERLENVFQQYFII